MYQILKIFGSISVPLISLIGVNYIFRESNDYKNSEEYKLNKNYIDCIDKKQKECCEKEYRDLQKYLIMINKN